MSNNDLGLSPMALARRGGQAKAMGQLWATFTSGLMADAMRVHESTVNEKQESSLTTKEKDETVNTEQLMQIIQQQHSDNIAQQNAIKAQQNDIASLKAMLENALSSVGTPSATVAKAKISNRDNVNWTIVGKTLFLAVNIDETQVDTSKVGTTTGKVFAKIAKAYNGHALHCNGLNVNLTVLEPTTPHAEDSQNATPVNQLGAALLGIPMSGIAEAVAVYRPDNGQDA